MPEHSITVLTENGIDDNFRATRRRCVAHNCFTCSGWSYSERENCKHTDCELHPYRTGKGQQDAQARNKAIRDYYLSCMNGQSGEIKGCTLYNRCALFPYRQSLPDWTYSKVIEKDEREERTPHLCRPISRHAKATM